MPSTTDVPSPPRTVAPLPRGALRALVLATLGFGLNFWAWALLSPLGPVFVERGITEDAALIVAVPVLVGSLGRILVGALTDRFGGRVMFPILSLLTVIPVLFLGFIGQDAYPTLLIGGFLLGLAGTTFAIGVPYVNSWFPPSRRGLATGLYGMGMGGTAISAFTTVPLVQSLGSWAPFVFAATALVAYAALAWFAMPMPEGWAPSRKSVVAQSVAAMRLPLTWQACYLYALSFGGYVAFSVFLPTMLKTWYSLTAADASLRLAGFVILAVLMRPIGGVLADRITAGTTLILAYAAVVLGAAILIAQPPLGSWGTVAFLLMAAGLGLGSGAVFALVAQTTDPAQVGTVTGFVGAAGGLGGFVPPLVMAAMHARTGSYSLGIALLLVATLGAIVVTLVVARGRRRSVRSAVPA